MNYSYNYCFLFVKFNYNYTTWYHVLNLVIFTKYFDPLQLAVPYRAVFCYLLRITYCNVLQCKLDHPVYALVSAFSMEYTNICLVIILRVHAVFAYIKFV